MNVGVVNDGVLLKKHVDHRDTPIHQLEVVERWRLYREAIEEGERTGDKSVLLAGFDKFIPNENQTRN